ncbi:site-specific integrase [Actinomarinicola tropica]|uniref:site-specific integrase n=1 Tax=Actinomarinicola tropica TaxID=2789776 RepID=UPI00189B0390|nr:site-specific integrase [Actinomarinicola tropica]
MKTGSARRTIDLDERTVDALRSWRLVREQEATLAGLKVSEDETVFACPDGSLTHPDYFSQVFDRHLATSELPRIRFHDLRHTLATILLKAGVHVKVVSERLGHSSPAFTMTVYQHVIPGM